LLVSDETRALEVVKALSDEYSRKIILCIITRSLPIEAISHEQHIPISTCYRRIHELESYGIVRADRTIVQEDGKKFVCYKSSFKSASIQLESGELKVDLVSNRGPEDKLHDIWQSVRSSKELDEREERETLQEMSKEPQQQRAPLIRA
jgi:DNA-binding Lrp family transcriptional regulator